MVPAHPRPPQPPQTHTRTRASARAHAHTHTHTHTTYPRPGSSTSTVSSMTTERPRTAEPRVPEFSPLLNRRPGSATGKCAFACVHDSRTQGQKGISCNTANTRGRAHAHPHTYTYTDTHNPDRGLFIPPQVVSERDVSGNFSYRYVSNSSLANRTMEWQPHTHDVRLSPKFE